VSSKEMGLLTHAGKTSTATEYKLRTYYIDIYIYIRNDRVPLRLLGFLSPDGCRVHPSIRRFRNFPCIIHDRGQGKFVLP